MSVGWVAGSVRAQSMTLRRLGHDGARALAASPSLELAVHRLIGSPYSHDVRAGQSLREAQDAVLATALWHLRVVAGWLPRDGAEIVRAFAGYWEIANVAVLVGSFDGSPASLPFDLGAVGTASKRLAGAGTPDAVRSVLRSSAWGDPGSAAPSDVLTWMRMRWAERLARSDRSAFGWGVGQLALLLARELFVSGRRPGTRRWPTSILGQAWQDATSIPDLAARVERSARWALEGVQDSDELWRAEGRWWTTVEREALDQSHRSRPGARESVVASVALLASDAWLVRGALEIAARGGSPMEAFDALG